MTKAPKDAAPTPQRTLYAAHREDVRASIRCWSHLGQSDKDPFQADRNQYADGSSPSCNDKTHLQRAVVVAGTSATPDAPYREAAAPARTTGARLAQAGHRVPHRAHRDRDACRDSERMECNPILEYAAEVRALEEAERRRKVEVVDVER